jgi:hypothetical protein
VTSGPPKRDVVFLVADGGMEQMLRGFLGRPQFHRGLRCGAFAFDPAEDVFVAPAKDPGVYGTAHKLLEPFQERHYRAVVMLDAEWEGSPGAVAIREHIAGQLVASWSEFAVVVIDPELEAWIWQDNPHIAKVFGCPDDFRKILAASGHWPEDALKPPDPKAALDHLRRRYRIRAFNASFGKLAGKISVRHFARRGRGAAARPARIRSRSAGAEG